MYKRLATAALAGIASAAVAPSAAYPSVSICTETSTLIYRSTTAYSTYYVTHTLGESGYPAPTGSAPAYGTGSSSAAPSPTGGYGNSSSSLVGPTGSYPPETTVTDVTTVYTTTCPAESTYTSGSETLTSTYTTVSTLTSTYQSTATLPGGYASSYIMSPGPYSSPASPVTTTLPPVVPYTVPSGNATYPVTSTDLPTASSSGYPVQQTGNAGVATKPLGALLGLAGLAAALL